MSCGTTNSLVVGRPSQQQYNNLCGSGSNSSSASVSSCGGGTGTCQYVSAHDRRLSPRTYRSKVQEDIKDYVLLMLGGPKITIELDDQQLDLAVNQSLKIFEDYAGREYFDYYTFNSSPGKSVYKLPDDVGIVRNVFYKETGNIAFAGSDMDGVIPVDYVYPGAGSSIGGGGGMLNPTQPMWGKAGEWTLYKQYETMFTRMSSNIGGWEFVSGLGHIKLYPIPCRSCKVIVHYLQKCKDWREVTQAMQEGALAHAMIMLGHIRGRLTNIPGPQGGQQLDGDYMRTKGWELKEKWQEELLTKFGDLPYITMG